MTRIQALWRRRSMNWSVAEAALLAGWRIEDLRRYEAGRLQPDPQALARLEATLPPPVRAEG